MNEGCALPVCWVGFRVHAPVGPHFVNPWMSQQLLRLWKPRSLRCRWMFDSEPDAFLKTQPREIQSPPPTSAPQGHLRIRLVAPRISFKSQRVADVAIPEG